jgi:HSP20 family protein
VRRELFPQFKLIYKEKIMVNLTRYNPVDDAFDDMFRGLLLRPMRMDVERELQIKLDVKEDEKNYTVHADMPGVKKEDIQVTIDGSQVSISTEVKDEKEVKEGSKLLRRERFYGKMSRTFTVDQDVDETASVAKYNNGVLELTLPKKATALSKKLEIH